MYKLRSVRWYSDHLDTFKTVFPPFFRHYPPGSLISSLPGAVHHNFGQSCPPTMFCTPIIRNRYFQKHKLPLIFLVCRSWIGSTNSQPSLPTVACLLSQVHQKLPHFTFFFVCFFVCFLFVYNSLCTAV